MFETVKCKDSCSEASESNCYNCETRDVFQNGVEDQKKHTLQQVVERLVEYKCVDCSTPNFTHLVIPKKVWAELEKEASSER